MGQVAVDGFIPPEVLILEFIGDMATYIVLNMLLGKLATWIDLNEKVGYICACYAIHACGFHVNHAVRIH